MESSGREQPDRFVPEQQPDGAVQLIRNPIIFNSARPAAVFDLAQVFNLQWCGVKPTFISERRHQ